MNYWFCVCAKTLYPPDMVSLLPPELGIHIFCHLDLVSVLTCRLVCNSWRKLADDNAVWRYLFFRREGWHINLKLAQARGWTPNRGTLPIDDYFSHYGTGCHSQPSASFVQRASSPYATPAFMTPAPPSPAVLLPSTFSPECSGPTVPDVPLSDEAPLSLPWSTLYRTRRTLDERWSSPSFTPQTMRISGHTNSVYCIEFDSTRIITGSRDHTVRVWRIADGQCLGKFQGHTGSVLCLKFEKDWDLREDGQPGLLVTGSSDRTVRVWDMWFDQDGAVEGQVREVLSGHRGGVLDLRVDDQWIVSSSKDAVVCIWNRRTLKLHRKLTGHEGPVNSIAMQGGRLVTASGDGKIMFWDVGSGECLRVFEGHMRGLACVEYKVSSLMLRGVHLFTRHLIGRYYCVWLERC
jgi:F-box and WD-40 domain protein 1/11